MQSFG
jgi:hypothetical protein